LYFANGQRKPGIMDCPTARKRPQPGGGTPATQAGSFDQAYAMPSSVSDPAPADPSDPRIFSGYAPNLWIHNPPAGVTLFGVDNTKMIRKFDGAKFPTQTPLMLDSMWRGGAPAEKDLPATANGQFNGVSKDAQHYAMKRHGKGINVGFFDGSVTPVKVPKLWEVSWFNDYDIPTAITKLQAGSSTYQWIY
jgi:prepilin-type processing-associated H-X9-DG protein